MLFEILSAKHPCYDAETWAKHDALYRGGKCFRAQISKFLKQNTLEPIERYTLRKNESSYRSYVGPIVDFYAAALFASSLVVRAKDDAGEVVDVDDFYSDWKEDCDGNGCDLVDFLHERFVSSLVCESAWWLVEMPDDGGAPAANKADWEARGLGRVTLKALQAECVYDWDCDDKGQQTWVTTHECKDLRDDPHRPRTMRRETWRIYDRRTVETYQIDYNPHEFKPQSGVDIPLVESRAHGFSRVPIVRYEVPVGMWLLDRVADAQVEHFRLSSALGWSIRQTCYAMPVFNIADAAKPPTMGAGYALMLGLEEKAGWMAPPPQAYDVIAKEISAQKDEIYRVTNQMAAGIDNNAAAIGRSGDSKAQDAAATTVCLREYGAKAREAIERTYELVGEARGDEYRWSVEGLDKFDISDASVVIANATQANLLNVPSPTFQKEMLAQVVDALLPNVEQSVKDAIRAELDDGVEEQLAMKEEAKEADHEASMAAIKTGAVPGTMAPKNGAPLLAKGKADAAQVG